MPRLAFPTLSLQRCEELERHIQDRTGRRVQALQVEVEDQCIILRGRTSSYYLKQLAQHCVWDVLPNVRLENGIVVD